MIRADELGPPTEVELALDMALPGRLMLPAVEAAVRVADAVGALLVGAAVPFALVAPVRVVVAEVDFAPAAREDACVGAAAPAATLRVDTAVRAVDTVAREVKRLGADGAGEGGESRHKVDLKGYDKLVLVEVYRNVVGMAVVGSEFEALRRFNLAEIYADGRKKIADDAQRGQADLPGQEQPSEDIATPLPSAAAVAGADGADTDGQNHGGGVPRS